jgi:hypothetical protein
MTIQKCLFDALLSRCQADISDCVARLTIYFNNSVGIGEHPQITEEMGKMLDELSSAEDRKAALLAHFSHYQDTSSSKCPENVCVENACELNCPCNP